MCSFLLYSLAMANMEIPLFLYVQDHFNWPSEIASYGFAYLGLILVITQGLLMPYGLSRWGERQMLVLGLSLGALGFALITVSHQLWLLALSTTIMGVGIALVSPSINGCISLLSRENEQGEALGINQSLSALGRIIGPSLGGGLYGSLGPLSPFIFGALLMGLALLLILSQFKKIPNSAKREG